MTSNIEQGIVAYLTTALTGSEQAYGTGDEEITINAATIDTKQVQIMAVTSSARVAERLPKIVVMADETNIEASDETKQLWRTKLEVMIGTPRRASEWTVENHRAFVAAVLAEMMPADQAGIGTALADFGITTCDGWFYAGTRDAHSDSNWITIILFDPFAFSVTL